MKVLAVHDAQGAIKSLGFASALHTGIGIRPRGGHQLSVIEIDAIEHAGHLSVYAKDYRVEFGGSQAAKLVRR